MRTLFLIFALACFPLPAVFGQSPESAPPVGHGQPSTNDQEPVNQQGNPPVFRKNVNLVNVLFTVKDKHGALVPNLSKDPFDLLDAGKP